MNMKSALLLLFCSFSGNFLHAQPPKLVIPIGHTGEVTKATFSPDGKNVLTVSSDCTANLWDVASGSLLQNFKSAGDASSVCVTEASFSPRGEYVIINYENYSLTIWEALTGKLIWDWGGTPSAYYVPESSAYEHFSPDAKRIAMFTPYFSDTITKSADPVIYDNVSKRPVFTLKGHKANVTFLRYTAQGKHIITVSADSTLKTWNASNGKLIASTRFTTDSIELLIHIPNSNLALIKVKGISRVIDIFSGKQIRLQMARDINEKEISYETDVNGNFIAGFAGYFESPDDDFVNRYEKILLWNAKTGKLLYQKTKLAVHKDGTLFSPDGKKITLIKADSTVQLADAQTGNIIYTLKGFTNLVQKAVYSANNEKILTTLSDRSLIIWNKVTSKLNPVLSSDTTMIDANYDDSYNLYDMNTQKKFFDMRQLKNFYQARYSPGGNIIADLRDRSISIWNAADGKLISTPEREDQIINDAVMSDNGKFVMVLSKDRSAKLWDINSGNYIIEYKSRSLPVKNAWFSNDNSKLFILTSQGEKVLNTLNGKLITDSFEINNAQNVKFQPSRDTLTSEYETTSPDGSLHLNWGPDIVQLSPATESGLAMLHGTGNGLGPQNGRMDSYVNSVVFSPDSKKLLLTVEDNTTRIFDIEKDKFISTIILFDSSEYINLTSGGYYQCTPNAAKILHYLTKDSKIVSFEQLDVKYNRPDIVLRTMGNHDSSLITPFYNAYIKRINKLGIDTTAFLDDYQIPEAEIINRDNIEVIQKKNKLFLQLKASGGNHSLDRFNIWINEVPLFGMKGQKIREQGKRVLDTTLTVTLSEGDNRIETSVTNINGIESYRKPIIVKYVPEFTEASKVYFIGVGINEFADSNYNLKWCVQDIRDLAKTMQEKYGSRLIIVDTLFNEQATRSNIRSLKRKLFNTDVNDKVIFSYSGHGLLSKAYDYYLSSYTVNFSDPEQGGIPYDEIENMLDSIPARKKILLLDACNSGEVDKDEMKKIQTVSADLAKKSTSVSTSGRGIITTNTSTEVKVGLQNSFELMQSLFVNVSKGTGAVIIAAAGGVQFAQERSELGHGVFTYSVIEAMKKYPAITVSTFKKYIGYRVTELTGGLQKPATRNETIAIDWNVW